MDYKIKGNLWGEKIVQYQCPGCRADLESPLSEEVIQCRTKRELIMEAEIFTLCESSSLHQGKHEIRGAASRLFPSSYPHRIEPFVMAFRLRLEVGEFGKHELGLELKNTTGQVFSPPLKMPFSIPATGEPCNWFASQLTLPFVILGLPGMYQMILKIDGVLVATSKLIAMPVKP